MNTRKAIIVGATSGIGWETAKILIEKGWKVGIAGRRLERLKDFQSLAPEQIEIQCIDVTSEEAPLLLNKLITKLGGMDLYLHSTGIGSQNPQLNADIELSTIQTNADGFARMIHTAFSYFRQHANQQKGHIAAITSVARTKGIGIAASYSATKRFQSTYLDALAQLIHSQKLPVQITDIRPGFVATDLLKSRQYPMLMNATDVAKRIVKGIERKRRILTIDSRYKILVFFWKLIPRYIWERIKIE